MLVFDCADLNVDLNNDFQEDFRETKKLGGNRSSRSGL